MANEKTEIMLDSIGIEDRAKLFVMMALLTLLGWAGTARLVRGQILYNAGKFPTLDLAGALKELHDYAIPKVFSDDSEEAPK